MEFWRNAATRVMRSSLLGLMTLGCGGRPASPTTPTSPISPQQDLNRAAVVDALDYWQSAAGIDYVLFEISVEPRILIRPGIDGLASQGGGRAVIDGTFSSDNRARSGLVVFEPGGGQYCRNSAAWCRYLYRHEIGHALGFIGHSDFGLMNATPDVLTDRERRMVTALYSLPHGARVQTDGTWSVQASGASGRLEDAQAAQDVMAWNLSAPVALLSGSSASSHVGNFRFACTCNNRRPVMFGLSGSLFTAA